MRVLVTGGAGYLGTVVCQTLAEAGHTVRCLDVCLPPPASLPHPKVEVFEASVTCTPAVRSALDGCQAVVHLAGLASDGACQREPQLARAVNLDASLVLARLARRAGCRRFVHASSASVYGNRDDGPQGEDAPTAPLSLYARYKLQVEEALNRAAGPDFEPVQLRQATLFGLAPRLRRDLVVNAMTREAAWGRAVVVRGGGGQWRPFVHVRDAARAVLAALEAPAALVSGEVFNVAGAQANLRIADVADLVRQVFPATPLVVAPDPPDPRSYRVACVKLPTVLGWRSRMSVADGIRELATALDRPGGVAACVNWGFGH